MYYFKKGLNSRLKVALSGHACRTLREMVNKVLEMERDRLEADALHKEKKCQFESSFRGPAPQRPRAHMLSQPRSRYTQGVVTTPSHGGGTYTTNYHRPIQSRPAPSCPTQGASTWRTATPTPTGSAPFTCFGCGQPGHKIAECPSRMAPRLLRPRQDMLLHQPLCARTLLGLSVVVSTTWPRRTPRTLLTWCTICFWYREL
jgi:hypothetical protein